MISYLYIYMFTIIMKSPFVCLIELSPVEDNVIITTEVKIRDIVYKIVEVFNIEREVEPIIKQYFEIHNKLLVPSLLNANEWIEIVRLVKVDIPGDMVDIVREVVNEITNFTDDSNEPVYKDKMIKLIDDFLQELELVNSVYGDDISIQTLIQNELMLKDSNSDEIYEEIEDESEIDNDSNEIWSPKDPLVSSGRRVFGGTTTTVKRFPFVAAVSAFGVFHCGGALISSDLVVTAASGLQLAHNNRLFRENPAFIEVRVGSSFHSLGGDYISVIHIYFYPGYDPATLKDNICLLRLRRHIKFQSKSKRVKKIEFDKNEAQLPDDTPGILLVGWGAQAAGNKVKIKGSLAYARLPVYALSECQEIYSKKFVTKKHFCAGYISKGGGACNQDVGDPAIYNGILYGIVSFGAPLCGAQESPTVFTKLGYYSDWMETIMDEVIPKKLTKTSTTALVVYFDNDATQPPATPSTVAPPYKFKNIERDRKPTESINNLQEVNPGYSTTKQYKKKKEQVKKTTETYYQISIKTSHHQRHHNKNIKTTEYPKHTRKHKKAEKNHRKKYTKRTQKQNKQKNYHTTERSQISDIGTAIFYESMLTRKPKKNKLIKHHLQQPSNDDVPLISKYKLRDLLRPKKPFIHLDTIKNHIHHKLQENGNYGNSVKHNKHKLISNDQVGKTNNTVMHNDKKQNKNHESIKISNNFLRHKSTIKNSHLFLKKEMRGYQLLNKTLDKYQVTPFYNKFNLHSPKHNVKMHHKMKYNYAGKHKSYQPKKLDYLDSPSYYDKSSSNKNFDAADFYENYDKILLKPMDNKDKPAKTEQKSLKNTDSYSDYDSQEEKYSSFKPNQIYSYNNKNRDRKKLPAPKILVSNDPRMEQGYKINKQSEDLEDDGFDPNYNQLTLSNVTNYSDYNYLDSLYEDYEEETPQHKATTTAKHISDKQDNKIGKHRTELSNEFEELNSHELKAIVKQIINQPEGSDKTELLQELLDTQNVLTAKNSSVGGIVREPGDGSYEV